jgi:hypothetical protein
MCGVTQLSSPAEAIAEEDALAVIVHRTNPLSSISPAMLKQVFTAQLLFWSNGQSVVPLNYAAGDALRTSFDRAVLGMSPERVGEYWVDQMVRAKARPPRKVASTSLALRVVAQLAGAIAYVPARSVTKEVKVVAIVKDGKVLAP